MNLELNSQQLDFLLEECNAIRENPNFSNFAQTIAQQLYNKLTDLKVEDLGESHHKAFSSKEEEELELIALHEYEQKNI